MRKISYMFTSKPDLLTLICLVECCGECCVLNFRNFLFAYRDIMVSDNMKFNGDFEATVDDT